MGEIGGVAAITDEGLAGLERIHAAATPGECCAGMASWQPPEASSGATFFGLDREKVPYRFSADYQPPPEEYAVPQLEFLEVGDVVRPTEHGEGPDFVGVITSVFPSSVANPYHVKWSTGNVGTGLERKQLVFLMRPGAPPSSRQPGDGDMEWTLRMSAPGEAPEPELRLDSPTHGPTIQAWVKMLRELGVLEYESTDVRLVLGPVQPANVALMDLASARARAEADTQEEPETPEAAHKKLFKSVLPPGAPIPPFAGKRP